MLLEERCDLDACDKKGWTALFTAVAARREVCAKALLDFRASADVIDNVGMSVKTLARQCNIDLAALPLPGIAPPQVGEPSKEYVEDWMVQQS
eukprot:2696700-Amphidinium_carterae.1